jgi:hypothetical protein
MMRAAGKTDLAHGLNLEGAPKAGDVIASSQGSVNATPAARKTCRLEIVLVVMFGSESLETLLGLESFCSNDEMNQRTHGHRMIASVLVRLLDGRLVRDPNFAPQRISEQFLGKAIDKQIALL